MCSIVDPIEALETTCIHPNLKVALRFGYHTHKKRINTSVSPAFPTFNSTQPFLRTLIASSNMSTITPQTRKPVFILSHPRTASNLFMKIFKSHPDVVPAEYPFLDLFFFGTESQCGRTGPEMEAARTIFKEKTGVPRSYQESFEKLEQDIRTASDQVRFLMSKGCLEGCVLILVRRAR